MDRYGPIDQGISDSPPCTAWMYSQLIRGIPIPPVVRPEAKRRAEREELERLARISQRHAEELSRIKSAELEARRERESLERWARISTRAEATLRALQQKEAEEQKAWRRAEEFYETFVAGRTKWVEADHPRQPKGSPEGGQFASKGGGGTSPGPALPSATPTAAFGSGSAPRTNDRAGSLVAMASDEKAGESPHATDPKAKYLGDFDKAHDLNLWDALKDGKLSAGDILRIKFSDDEIKQILQSANAKPSGLNLHFYTASNLPPKLRETADHDYPDLPPEERYALQAFISNQRRARVILMARNPAFQQYVRNLYEFFRALNPVHFAFEKGFVIGSGKEPVLGDQASRLGALKDLLTYLAIMKGVEWGIAKLVGIIAGPEAGGATELAFQGGGKVTIQPGAKYDAEVLGDAIQRAARGENVEIKPPAKPVPALPRPSLTEVPRIKDDPTAFRRWFNELTPEELRTAWKSPRLRDQIEKGLRWPSGQHEWLMIARAPKFKEWGLTAEDIAAMRTRISKIRFKNPPGRHEGDGATTTHNQILKIIDSSPDFPTFKARLQKWANDRLEGGANALPPGLRP